MLPPPLLDIRRYHVDSFAFVAHDAYDTDRPSAGVFDVDFDVQENAEDENTYRISMAIKVAEGGYTAEENAPYSVSMDIVGYFLFALDTAEQTKARMIHLNGASILYVIARGFVGQATGAAKNGQYVLPSVNFLEMLRQRVAAESTVQQEQTSAAITAGEPTVEPPHT